jgi:hypothetical protein
LYYARFLHNERHARYWGVAWSRKNGHATFSIMEIDPKRLKGCWIFKAQRLIYRLDLLVPENVNLRNEYLVLHQISWIAIVRCWTEELTVRLLNSETITGVLKRSDRSSGDIRQFEEGVGDVSEHKSVHGIDR